MSDRPRLLDLFCGAGGCSRGYADAGFDVSGVDIEEHSDYPYPIQVLDALEAILDGYDVVHASPPCQASTTMSNRWRGKSVTTDAHVNLIPVVREKLLSWGGPYVIENVPGARPSLRDPILLSGGWFGLQVERPRLFESNMPLAPAPRKKVDNPIGVYGKLDGRRLWTRKDGTEQRCARTLEEGRRAMGIDWMQWHDLTEAVPPAYTEYIGRQLLEVLDGNG